MAYPKNVPGVNATFLCGDTPFIEPEAIDTFALEATQKDADIVFQIMSAKDDIGSFRKKKAINTMNI